tara:strand:+ start:218 stop:517 length:300 start_codon:yes stop_codon:yes gene_type:complete
LKSSIEYRNKKNSNTPKTGALRNINQLLISESERSVENGENHPPLKVRPTALIPKNKPENIAINSSSNSILIWGINTIESAKIKMLFIPTPTNKQIKIS